MGKLNMTAEVNIMELRSMIASTKNVKTNYDK